MQSIHYRPGKMAFGALCAVGLAMLCGWLWVANDSTFMGLSAFAFGACAVMGVTVIVGTMFIVVNLLVDILPGVMDPRETR